MLGERRNSSNHAETLETAQGNCERAEKEISTELDAEIASLEESTEAAQAHTAFGGNVPKLKASDYENNFGTFRMFYACEAKTGPWDYCRQCQCPCGIYMAAHLWWQKPGHWKT